MIRGFIRTKGLCRYSSWRGLCSKTEGFVSSDPSFVNEASEVMDKEKPAKMTEEEYRKIVNQARDSKSSQYRAQNTMKKLLLKNGKPEIFKESFQQVHGIISRSSSGAKQSGVFLLDSFSNSGIHAIGYIETPADKFLEIVENVTNQLKEMYKANPENLKIEKLSDIVTMTFELKTIQIYKRIPQKKFTTIQSIHANSRVKHIRIVE